MSTDLRAIEIVDEISPALERVLGLIEELRANLTAEATSAPAEPIAPSEPTNDASFAFTDYGRFYDFLRGNKMLGPVISADEFAGCDAILKACTRQSWPVSFTAYAMATAFLETAATMQPIKERGGTAYFHRMYDIQGARPAKARELGNLSPGDGARYCGRGYVQLTGKANYAKATAKLRALGFGVDLVANPDLALRPDIAAAIMVLGMSEGWFTGRKLSDDLPARGPASASQFKASRDIINGRDKDDEIAAFAVDFQTGLQAGGYRIAA
jgi:putative chitinase